MESKRKLLLFDLDETLVHAFDPQSHGKKNVCSLIDSIRLRDKLAEEENARDKAANKRPSTNPLLYNQDHILLMNKPKPFKEDDEPTQQSNYMRWMTEDECFIIKGVDYVIIMRPYLIHFIARLYEKDKFDLGIFSMGDRLYVDSIVDEIEKKVNEVLKRSPDDRIFKVRRYHEHARPAGDMKVKDLSILEDAYNVEQIILVDNLPLNFAKQRNNCIPIRPFTCTTMVQREFVTDSDNKPQFFYDLGLLRLEQYLDTVQQELSIEQENIFTLRE